MSYHIS